MKIYERIKEEYGTVDIIKGSLDKKNQITLNELIYGSKFCMSFGSTTIVDVMIREKLVLFVMLPGCEMFSFETNHHKSKCESRGRIVYHIILTD